MKILMTIIIIIDIINAHQAIRRRNGDEWMDDDNVGSRQ